MLPDRIGFLHIREMAGRSEHVGADLGLVENDRLGSLLSESFLRNPDAARHLRVDARFVERGHGFPELECSVTGFLPVDCQRCLTELDWPVELEFSLALVESEAALERIGDRFDAVVVGEQGFSLAESVTDEVLGSMPLAPMHAEPADCTGIEAFMDIPDAAADGSGVPAGQESRGDEPGEAKNRPFAELAALVKRGNGDDGTKNH